MREYHTDTEARTKECPIKAGFPTMTQAQTYVGLHQQQGGWYAGGAGGYATPCYQQSPAMCSGSACMMWRAGGRQPRVVERTLVDPEECPLNPPPPGWTRNGDHFEREEWFDVGYCGLAGEP